MKLRQFRFSKHPLQFITPATTSRDTLITKPTWFIHATFRDGKEGVGEVSIIDGLSVESSADIDTLLTLWVKNPESALDFDKDQFPSVAFALEMCMLDQGNHVVFSNDFTLGNMSIPINGLVWMADVPSMIQSAKEKVEQGFDCIKLKIGAKDWKEEIEMIRILRSHHDSKSLMIRVDANGAFAPEEAMRKLDQLARLEVHSIEQPVHQRFITASYDLCKDTPIPIALDEQLIGVKKSRRESILEQIQPQYIILKPSLIGGLSAADHWIQLAEERGIGWWSTSALESNIGLNAIAQWIAEKPGIAEAYQGLGTGKLYSNNIQAPLEVKNGHLHYTKGKWGSIPWEN